MFTPKNIQGALEELYDLCDPDYMVDMLVNYSEEFDDISPALLAKSFQKNAEMISEYRVLSSAGEGIDYQGKVLLNSRAVRLLSYIHGFEADMKTVEAHPQIAEGFCGMEIMGKAYTEKADAGEILLAACKDTKSADPVPLGSYRGFQMELSFDSFRNEFDVTLKGAVSHRVALGTDARGNITRLDNALAGIPERLERANEQLNNLYNQQEAAKAEVGKPFPQEAELTAKSQRLAELDAALNMEDSVENRDERSESERPSVLADLKSKAEHIPPAKYAETREEVL